jgi:dienelactone hydrolase
MRKLGSIILILFMILSVVPGISTDEGQPDELSEEDLPVIATGTRATIKNESVTFTSGSTTVSGHLYYDPIPGKRPAIVFGVGYTAQVTDLFDSSNYGWIAEHLATEGYIVLVVRYAAPYDNPMELLNLTGDYSLWVQQTKDAVTSLKTDALLGATTAPSTIVDPARIALGGHSIGGAVSIVSAAQDRRVKLVFVMSPQNYAGSPRMNSFVDDLSPTPILLQVGELDAFGGVATVQQSYNAASSPKQIATYRYGTYEGFTDIGSLENIDIDDMPSNISDPLKPIISSQPFNTKQHDMSKKYTTAFLDYYLMNDDSGFNFMADYTESFVITNFPLPPFEVPDVWHATEEHSDLDVIFHSASTSPDELDFQNGNSISVRARISPKGIWEDHVDVVLTYPEGATESYPMEFNDTYDVDAGYYSVELENIPISHSLGTVLVNITAKDSEDNYHTYSGLSFEITTTSPAPKIDDISYSPDPITPGEKVTFTISASDEDGDSVDHFKIDFGDGSESGWVESNTIEHTFAESGHYNLRAMAKDEKAAESDEKLITLVVSSPPEADLTVKASVKEGDELELDGSDSSDPDGDTIEYFFTFGDGIESGWVPTSKVYHRYDEIGEVVVKLKVRDEFGRESPEVQSVVNVKENSGDSVLSSVTSSGGFPLIIILVVIIIVVGGIFLLRGEDEDGNEYDEKPGKGTTSDPKKKKKGSPIRDGAGPPMGKPGRKPIPGSKSIQQPSDTRPDSAMPITGQGRDGEPQIDAPPVPSTPQVDAPPVAAPSMETPSNRAQPPMATPQQPGPLATPPVNSMPAPPVPPAPPAQSFPSQEEPMASPVPRNPQPPEIPPSQAPSPPPSPPEPEIDAPPLEDEGENWDDFDDDQSDDTGSSDGGWEDDDFAIPVALKEKLNRESE